jgi:hypothetical protein
LSRPSWWPRRARWSPMRPIVVSGMALAGRTRTHPCRKSAGREGGREGGDKRFASVKGPSLPHGRHPTGAARAQDHTLSSATHHIGWSAEASLAPRTRILWPEREGRTFLRSGNVTRA